MRMSLFLAVLTMTFTQGNFAAAGDDLLSEIRLDSTVAPPATNRSTEPAGSPRGGKQVGGASSLQSLLLAAGYSAKVTGLDEVTATVSRSDWTAEVIISVALDGRNLRIAMRLPQSGETTEITPKTLRDLLDANGKQWGIAFAIAGDGQKIELRRTIPNDALTSSSLREDLDAMADYAEKTSDLWKSSGISASEPETPAETAPSTTTPEATGSLTGKWIASPSTSEAFALQLDADGSFKLVHVNGSKSTKSQGTYQLSSNTLTLKGDAGNTLTGTVARRSGGFDFSLKGAGGKTVTLTFKSGS